MSLSILRGMNPDPILSPMQNIIEKEALTSIKSHILIPKYL